MSSPAPPPSFRLLKNDPKGQGICRGVLPVVLLTISTPYTPNRFYGSSTAPNSMTLSVSAKKKIMMRSPATDNCFYPFDDLKAAFSKRGVF
jgi:hypothetical protein